MSVPSTYATAIVPMAETSTKTSSTVYSSEGVADAVTLLGCTWCAKFQNSVPNFGGRFRGPPWVESRR